MIAAADVAFPAQPLGVAPGVADEAGAIGQVVLVTAVAVLVASLVMTGAALGNTVMVHPVLESESGLGAEGRRQGEAYGAGDEEGETPSTHDTCPQGTRWICGRRRSTADPGRRGYPNGG